MSSNPFTLSFGREPSQYISRTKQVNDIIDTFTDDDPSYQVCMITGVRGSGKTVLLSEISKQLSAEEDWIIADLNPERDLLTSLASKLYSIPDVHDIIRRAKLDLSFFGLGVSLEQAPPITDVETALDKIFECLDRQHKRVLITVDEVVPNKEIKVFSAAFQIFLRHHAPVFLLMTGLYDNIYDLQNEKTLTFLYRAPKIILPPLSLNAIKESYRRTLNISDALAGEMAVTTKGYPFAYQVLGYLFWKMNGVLSLSELLPDFDQILEEYVYAKIWSELSLFDRSLLKALAASASGSLSVKQLRECTGFSSGKMSVYRDRLKKAGVLDVSEYGYLSFALPRFGNFVRLRTAEY